ncbi:hypothetical protein F5888DRAFT_1640880 [Russula emetica]|nr:hypothetical protein F5888DRAFT_1640880 [Russula emetica]
MGSAPVAWWTSQGLGGPPPNYVWMPGLVTPYGGVPTVQAVPPSRFAMSANPTRSTMSQRATSAPTSISPTFLWDISEWAWETSCQHDPWGEVPWENSSTNLPLSALDEKRDKTPSPLPQIPQVDENLPPSQDSGEAPCVPTPFPLPPPGLPIWVPQAEEMHAFNLLAEVTVGTVGLRFATPLSVRADPPMSASSPLSQEDLLTGPRDSAERAELECLLTMADPESELETKVPASDSPDIDPFFRLVDSVIELERV